MDSILNSVKKVLGIVPQYEYYDEDLILHINTVFAILNQYGVGDAAGYFIRDANDIWTDFIGDDSRLNLVKTFVYAKVRIVFDPPSNSAAAEALKKFADELESRIIYMTDHIEEEGSS